VPHAEGLCHFSGHGVTARREATIPYAISDGISLSRSPSTVAARSTRSIPAPRYSGMTEAEAVRLGLTLIDVRAERGSAIPAD